MHMSQDQDEQTYTDSIDQLLTLADFERKSRADQPPDWHLQRVRRLMHMLADPHLAKPVIHVAGSKGKGSTAAMIASALHANGYNIGLYTSPHLHRFTERIRVNNAPISKGRFARLVQSLWRHVEQIREEGDIGVVSVFEMLTAMAFTHFRDDADIDIAVIEVGLGGRLDATNIVQPEIAVITPVSLDHVPILGNTVAQIAAEKAGIIKRDSVTVSARQAKSAQRVIQQHAAKARSKLIDAIQETRLIGRPRISPDAHSFSIRNGTDRFDVTLQMLGQHQIDNARTAIAAIGQMSSLGFPTRAEATARGISDTRWECRCEVLTPSSDVKVLIDGAHNRASARVLALAVQRHFGRDEPVGLIIGGTAGHDPSAVARELSRLNLAFCVPTQSRHPKSMSSMDIHQILKGHSLPALDPVSAVKDAVEAAISIAQREGIRLVIAAGSLFVAAEAREKILRIDPEIYEDLSAPFSRPYEAVI